MVAWQERLVHRVQGVVRVRGEAEAQVDALLHRGQELGHWQLHLGRHGVRLEGGGRVGVVEMGGGGGERWEGGGSWLLLVKVLLLLLPRLEVA